MMDKQPRLTFTDHGAEKFAGAVAGSLADLQAALAHLPSDQAGVRIHGIEALRPFLTRGGAIGSIAAIVLNQKCQAVRAIFFDKTAEMN